ncbi:unnamed protein product [Agarophyton chilense]
MWRRFSTNINPGVRLRELKKHVFRLYKHIHPDRLGRFPEERKVNEQSFQVLKSAIDRHFDRAEAQSSVPPEAPKESHQLIFYAHRVDTGYQSDMKGLTKAIVSLHESRLGQALASLFKELGLDPPPESILPGAGIHFDSANFSSLTELVKHARRVEMESILHKNQDVANATQKAADEVLVTRLALQRSKGLTIVLGTGLPAKLEKLFRRLSRIARQLQDVDLRTLVIELDGGFHVKVHTNGYFPFLVLGACASDETWLRTLKSEEIRSAVTASQGLVSELHDLETELARALGVRLVMHNITLIEGTDWKSLNDASRVKGQNLSALISGSKSLETYHSLLQSFVESIRKEYVPILVGARALALMFTEGHGFRIDTQQGVLQVGINDDQRTIAETLRAHGQDISREYEKKKEIAENEEKRLSCLRRTLGIPGLRRLEEVTDEDWNKVLSKLNADSRRLRGVLDGIPLVIGTQARMVVDTGEIEIPFDYDQWLPV